MREWLRRQTERVSTFNGLNAARRQAFRIPNFDVQRDRYIILSDTHKGDRTDGVDEFALNEDLYVDALTHYLDEDYRLVLNGDIEEGWKSSYRKVVEAYKDTAIALEREFARRKNAYFRIFGNHDADLAVPQIADRLLSPVMGRRIQAYPAVLLGDQIFIVHGHQGDPHSDRMAWLSRRIIHYLWRPLQRYLKYTPRYSPSIHAPSGGRDKHLSAWARASDMLLIAGHTHRTSMLSDMGLNGLATDGDVAWGHYINGGCCVYDRTLTGVEIDRGEIRLVRWDMPLGAESRIGAQREVILSADLSEYLRKL